MAYMFGPVDHMVSSATTNHQHGVWETGPDTQKELSIAGKWHMIHWSTLGMAYNAFYPLILMEAMARKDQIQHWYLALKISHLIPSLSLRKENTKWAWKLSEEALAGQFKKL